MEFPWDINNLLGGEVRVLWTPVATAAPANPKAVVDQISPYAKTALWNDFGAARDASSYSRAIAATDWTIQQSDSAVVRRPSSVTRRVTLSIAEFTEKTLQIIEVAPSTGTVAAAAGLGAQKEVGMGDVDSFPRYRIAFQSMRDTSAGKVIEPATAVPPSGERGRFVMGVGWEASITADEVSLEQAKATQSAVNVTFEFYPVSSQTAAKRYGVWWLEDAGTIA